MIGFETIGNATLTVFDGKPMISTDPGLMEIHILVAGHIPIKFQKNKKIIS